MNHVTYITSSAEFGNFRSKHIKRERWLQIWTKVTDSLEQVVCVYKLDNRNQKQYLLAHGQTKSSGLITGRPRAIEWRVNVNFSGKDSSPII